MKLFDYDDKGNLIMFVNCKGNPINYAYDDYRNLTKIIDSEKGCSNYEYTNNYLSHISYPNGTGRTFKYDSKGRLICQIDGK